MRAAGEVWFDLSGGTLELGAVDRRHVVTVVRCASPCSSQLGKVLRAPEAGLLWVGVLYLDRRRSGARRVPSAAWLDDPLDSRGRPMTVEMTCRRGAFYSLDYADLLAAASRGERLMVLGVGSSH